ncbi:S-layer homology domain-containing protein [Sporosarcina oncorhynchi]|uniref:S-layer homology domain-containing protein n=1 Tax=Sporosarcina oncorhynchi TaxID=3056444 RepID=A0ABZ0L7F5_9BACL|nr:S-layer homology domain-containing protein [Sporosarcina sp. T2O-4]WOV88055.1 S-layer homology domain-containing protein [Sporosarcina sp. T2O-4]
MINQRKFLASTLAATLVATAVVPAASAASFKDLKGNTHEEAVLALVNAKVINGYPDGTFKPNKTLTRSDVVKLLGKYLVSEGFQVPSDYKTKSRFTDVTMKDSGDELLKYAAMVKDYGILGGSNGKLLAKEDMTREDMAIALVRLINVVEVIDVVSYVDGQRFTGDVTDLHAAKASARPYILVLDYFDITNPALDKFNPKSTTTRGQFATFLFRVTNQKIGDMVAPKADLTDFKATGSDTFTVVFNQEVELKNAKYAVKKGNSDVAISSVEISKDKKSAKLIMSSKLSEGNYTVSVSGVADSVFMKTTAVANEKAASIEFLNEHAVPDATGNKVRIGYKVINQYGEDMTSNVPNVVASSNVTGTGSDTIVKHAEGIVEITKATRASNFKQGDKISVSITDRATAITQSKVVTVVSKSKVSEVDITGLYNDINQSATFNIDANYEDFHLVLTAKDQYDMEVPAQDIADDVTVSVSDRSIIDVNRSVNTPVFTQLTIDGKRQTVLELKKPNNNKQGTAVISIRSKSTGKTATYEVTVAEGVKADTIALGTPQLTVADEKTEVPFLVYGTDGKEISNTAVLNNANGVNVMTNDRLVKAVIENDPLTGKAKLYLIDSSNATSDRQVLITATTANNKATTMYVTMRAKAEASRITAMKDIETNVFVGGVITLSKDAIVVIDQYGRDIVLNNSNMATAVNTSNTGKYVIDVVALDDKVALSSNRLITATNAVTVTGKKKGSDYLRLNLQQIDSRGVARNVDSGYELNVKVTDKSSVVQYELKNIDIIYDNPAKTSTNNYAREVIVYGLTTDGNRVVIPASEYTVITGHEDLIYNASTGTIYVRGNKDIVDKDDQYIPVKVIVNADRQPVTLDQTVIITKAEPYANTVELQSSIGLTVQGQFLHIPGTTSNVNISSTDLKAVLKITDQYGEDISRSASDRIKLTATNLVNSNNDSTVPAVSGNGTNTLTFTGVQRGDSFFLTYFVDGKTLTTQVVVGQ